MVFDFSNRVAIVTGAASGIGQTVSSDLIAAGATVALIDKQPPEVSCRQAQTIYYQGDLTDADFVQEAIADLFSRYGRIDYLANIAGALWFDRDQSFIDIDLGIWDEVIAINLNSTMHAARSAIPFMQQSGGGALVNFSSIQCLRGDNKPQDAYQVAKAGIVALSKSIAVQYAGDGIRSNTILPGPTQTPLQSRWNDDTGLKDATAEAIPLGRVGKAGDMANACLFLLSDAASFITGTELIIDGGLTALP